MPDFLTAKRGELAARRDELAPMAAEHARIVEAIDALDSAVPEAAASTNGGGAQPRRRGPGRPRTATPRPRSRGAGRKKGSGKRGAEALALINAASADGITLQGVADKLGIKPNYLYRVLPPLEAEGKIKKLSTGEYVGTGARA